MTDAPTPQGQERDITTADSLRLRIRETGTAGPPVILVHGNFASRRWWTDQLASQPEDMRLIALDLPNFGASDRLPGTPNLDGYAAAVGATLDALGIDAAILVGHSLGAGVVERFALSAPQRVLGMVLMDGAPPEGLPRPEEQYAMLASFIGQREMLAAALAPMAATRTPPYWEELLDDAVAMAPEAYEGNARALGTATLPAAPVTWESPVLVLHGALDPLITADMAAATARHWPGATLESWPDVGHSPQIEQPERFLSRLTTFVKEAAMT